MLACWRWSMLNDECQKAVFSIQNSAFSIDSPLAYIRQAGAGKTRGVAPVVD